MYQREKGSVISEEKVPSLFYDQCPMIADRL